VRRIWNKVLVAKVLAVLAVLSLGGAAAGASGLLSTQDPPGPALEDPAETDAAPEPIEETSTTISDSSSTTLPAPPDGPDDSEGPGPGNEGGPRGEPGPDPNGPAGFGLCRAFGDREQLPEDSVAAQRLRGAAEEAGQSVKAFCEQVARDRHARPHRGRPGHPKEHPHGKAHPEGKERPAGRADGRSRGADQRSGG
jgi:hypothetical protein